MNLNFLRHRKNALRQLIGRVCLRLASRNPSRSMLGNMRSRLGIQLSVDEMELISDAVVRKRPAQMVVFGTGKDSDFWQRLNRGGHTLFIEDDADWVQTAKRVAPQLNINHVNYQTDLSMADELIESQSSLADGIPSLLKEKAWDCILVDGPRGCEEGDPGRMKSIYWASLIASEHTDVFIHDCNRRIEDSYCNRYFEPNLRAQVGRLRHYRRQE